MIGEMSLELLNIGPYVYLLCERGTVLGVQVPVALSDLFLSQH